MAPVWLLLAIVWAVASCQPEVAAGGEFIVMKHVKRGFSARCIVVGQSLARQQAGSASCSSAVLCGFFSELAGSMQAAAVCFAPFSASSNPCYVFFWLRVVYLHQVGSGRLQLLEWHQAYTG
jgi:hypothetical protein